MHKVGIIGAGFVGSAVETGLQTVAEVGVYDKYKDSESLYDVVNNSDVLFVCVRFRPSIRAGIMLAASGAFAGGLRLFFSVRCNRLHTL